MTRDELTTPWQADPDAAEELIALGTVKRARKAGRTYTPSALSRPLPGAPGVPARKPLLDLDDLEEVA